MRTFSTAYLGGMMTWSINWDAVTSCNSTAYEYAANYETVFPEANCQQPNLGDNISACELTFPYTLNSQTTTNTNVTFTWTNLSTNTVLINSSTSANTLVVSNAGTYQVKRDSAGCSKSDEIIITADLPTPVLAESFDLCLTLPASATVSNSSDFPVETTWAWYKDDIVITDTNTSTYTDIRAADTYKVIATYGDCNTENSLTVTSSLPEPIDACGISGSAITLGINTAEAATYNWYAAATEGSVLGTGLNFTTPALSTTTTYYVEVVDAVGDATTGPAASDNDLGALGNYFSPHELYFDASTNFVLKGLTIYLLIYCGTHTVSIEIRDAANTLLTNGQHDFSLTGDNDCSTLDTAPQTISFSGGITIPQGTGYQLIITSSVGVNFWEGNVNFPMEYTPFFSITGSDETNKYLAIHDWEVEGANCARLPVIATISPDCSDSCPTHLDFDNSAIDGGNYFAAETIEAASTISDGQTVTFKAVTSITLSTGFHAASGSQFLASIEACSTSLVASSELPAPLESRSNASNEIIIIEEQKQVLFALPIVKIFPNPVRSAATLSLTLPESIPVHLEVYDLNGRKISTLVNGSLLGAGLYEYYWDCSAVEAGIYFLVLNGRHVGKLIKM